MLHSGKICKVPVTYLWAYGGVVVSVQDSWVLMPGFFFRQGALLHIVSLHLVE